MTTSPRQPPQRAQAKEKRAGNGRAGNGRVGLVTQWHLPQMGRHSVRLLNFFHCIILIFSKYNIFFTDAESNKACPD